MTDDTRAPGGKWRGGRAVAALAGVAAAVAAVGPAAVVEDLGEDRASPAPETASAAPDGFPDSLQVTPRLAPENHEPRVLYHLGTLPGCPRQNIELGGIAFHRFTKGALIGENRVEGQRVLLSRRELAQIKAAIEKRVVRWIGTGDVARTEVLVVDAAGFRPDERDESIGRYLYCERVRDEQVQVESRPKQPMA